VTKCVRVITSIFCLRPGITKEICLLSVGNRVYIYIYIQTKLWVSNISLIYWLSVPMSREPFPRGREVEANEKIVLCDFG
jgi:hypothetical protein